MKRFLSISLKIVSVCLLVAVAALGLTGISPIFDFEGQKPFCGPDIFNPYRHIETKHIDTTHSEAAASWKKANFHTHTRIKGLLNECPEWPDRVVETYESLGYEIVALSNHNQFTRGDSRPDSLKITAYEHGYNLFQFHKLVFESTEVNHWDNLIPLLTSQCQWQFDLLGKDAELIQFNHPARTRAVNKGKLEKLSGYNIFELNALYTETEHIWWDWALSAGHYSFALANDDLHDSNNTQKVARRCNFLRCKSCSADSVLSCLKDGCFYCMQLPDWGEGDWEIKREMNRKLPSIKDIGVKGNSTVFIRLDREATQIVFTGQDGRKLESVGACDRAEYRMNDEDSYARITCYFSDGSVLFTNPFARYDKTKAATPFTKSPHPVNLPLTILWNLLMILVASGAIIAAVKVLKRR